MIVDFEYNALQFLLHDVRGLKFLPYLPEDLLKGKDEHQFVFVVFKFFQGKYSKLPAKAEILQELSKVQKKKGFYTSEKVKEISFFIENLYRDKELNYDYVATELVTYVLKKESRSIGNEILENLSEDNFNKLLQENFKKLNQLLYFHSSIEHNLTDTDKGLITSITDISELIDTVEVLPTPFPTINELSKYKGWAKGQLITIMAPPKSFKTALLINLAVHYVNLGKNVFYADFENGRKDIQLRFLQSAVGATYESMVNKHPTTLTNISYTMEYWKHKNSQFNAHSFYAFSDSVHSVEAELDRLKNEGILFDVIIFDSIYLMGCGDKTVREDYKKLTQNYFDVKNLAKKYNLLAITPAKTRREALHKAIITETDVAGDYGIIANSDGTYAICQTLPESKLDIARIIPISLRFGAKFKGTDTDTCFIKVNAPIQKIEEVSLEAIEMITTSEVKELYRNNDILTGDGKITDD